MPCHDSVSEITGNASLTLFFAADTVSALTAPVMRVTQTVFFVANTIGTVTVIHCFGVKQHCFLELQHCLDPKFICFFKWKSFSINEVALPAPSTHCFGVKQHCFFKLQHCIGPKQYCFFKRECGFAAKRHCFFMKQHRFVTKRLCSVTMQPGSGPGKPWFFPETLCSVTKTLASGEESSRSASLKSTGQQAGTMRGATPSRPRPCHNRGSSTWPRPLRQVLYRSALILQG